MKKILEIASLAVLLISRLLLVAIQLLVLPVSVLATNHCPPLELSAEEVHEIIKKEREKRGDLPSAYSKPEYVVKKMGCYYLYEEYELPRKPEDGLTFLLNRFGVIVDITLGGRQWEKMKCPEKVFSEKELTGIIKNAREVRNDLPEPFLNYQIKSSQSLCEYFYQEKDLSDGQNASQMFRIDAFGELRSFSINKSK